MVKASATMIFFVDPSTKPIVSGTMGPSLSFTSLGISVALVGGSLKSISTFVHKNRVVFKWTKSCNISLKLSCAYLRRLRPERVRSRHWFGRRLRRLFFFKKKKVIQGNKPSMYVYGKSTREKRFNSIIFSYTMYCKDGCCGWSCGLSWGFNLLGSVSIPPRVSKSSRMLSTVKEIQIKCFCFFTSGCSLYGDDWGCFNKDPGKGAYLFLCCFPLH